MTVQIISALIFTYASVNIVVQGGLVFLPVALFGVASIILALPFPREKLHAAFPKTSFIGWKTGLALGYVILFVQIISATTLNSYLKEREQIRIAEETKKRGESEKKNALREFEQNRERILRAIATSIDEGTPDKGFELAKKFIPHVSDPEFSEAAKRAEIAALKNEISRNEKLPLERAVVAYEKLSEAEPENELYEQKLASAKRGLALIENGKRLEQELEKFDKKVKRQLSSDGSHPAVVNLVKSLMHNPDSFQHVGTSYLVQSENAVRITMRYRGTNMMGGVVTNYAIVTLDRKGKVINFEQP